MSFSATPDRPVPHSEAYALERRWFYIDKHLNACAATGVAPRCGHLACSYGGGIITKADVQARFAEINELGGGK